MNKNIRQLADISDKKERTIIGLMSGTSLDGLDVAVCRVSGKGFTTTVTVTHFETVPYSSAFKNEIKEIAFRENISFLKLTQLHRNIALLHAEMVNALLQKWNLDHKQIDLLASHGQTVYHSPAHKKNITSTGCAATLQIGDGDTLAVETGIITISDFRQKNISGGGEGAPLAAYGDMLLFAEKNTDVILLNIGGIANFSFIPAGFSNKIISSDLGPGNTLMDQWMSLHYPGKFYDAGALIASSGNINRKLLLAFKEHPFFKQALPKTTGPEMFNIDFVNSSLSACKEKNISPADVMATLNKFSADIICETLNSFTENKKNIKLYISGGGIHNPLLMQHLHKGLTDINIADTWQKGIHPDAKEAVLFALLANECIAGEPEAFKNFSEKIPAISMGKISFPY